MYNDNVLVLNIIYHHPVHPPTSQDYFKFTICRTYKASLEPEHTQYKMIFLTAFIYLTSISLSISRSTETLSQLTSEGK